ncbi:MAG: adenine phosphoribosyltransferase [Gammaproteobacteria bacterium]|nr:MAG: adenine phosphoribosyltransferase [Gammaproteobacteria bacterium]
MSPEQIKALIRDIPDFPEPGIVFKDITPVLASPPAFAAVVDFYAERLAAANAEVILAIESRGFIFGAAVARLMGLPMHLVRKQGKLPHLTVGIDYELEYGSDRLEIHREALLPGRRYAVVDDLLATGGTAGATVRLVREHGGQVACCAFMIELGFLNGAQRLGDCRVDSLLVLE